MAETFRDRLLRRITELGWSKSRVNREANVGQTVVHDIFNKDASPSVDNFARIADAIGLSMTELYHGDDKLKLHIHVVGSAREGEMWTQLPQPQQHIVPIEFSRQDLVSLEVVDDSYEPRFSKGDCLIGVRPAGPNLDNLIGLECIALTTDGQRYVRFLHRGSRSGHYTLRGHHPKERDVVDAKLAWAAPIRMILRNVN
jgi:transcriptional regulator with XRE-family HTH domain